MMPLYTSRPKKTRKDGAHRSSFGSILSSNSNSAPKGSRSSVERPRKDGAEGPSKAKKKAINPKSPGTQSDKPPNVFEYLEPHETDATSSSEDDDGPPIKAPTQPKVSRPSISTARPTNPTTAAVLNGRTRASSMKSKGSAESHQPPPVAPILTPPVAPLQLARTNSTQRKMSLDGPNSTLGRGMDLATVPESFYRDPPSYHGPPLPPSPPRSPEEDLHRTSRGPRHDTHSSQHASGYGLLAWRLSSSTDSEEPRLPPLYRRFEDLNHRVLLHLQDEIAQMEEELHVLDECDEMHRASAAEKDGSKMLPASRRMDVQAGVYSSLHYQREELMSALIRKTEQYNNALSAYSRVLQTLPLASDQNVDAYRTWMHGNSPIAAVESRFLDHPKDLVSLTPPVTPIGSAPTPSVYSAIIIASAAILLPLLAFSMIRDFWGRVLLVALVGGASAGIASTTSAESEQLVASQDGWRCAGLYFGFMMTAAMFVP